MSIAPSDLLDSAKEFQLASAEVATRNAISRAYYAAYHQARGVFPPDSAVAHGSNVGVHQTYIDQLMQHGENTVERKTAVKLAAMKGRRTKADYFLGAEIKQYEGAMQIKTAEDLFVLFEAAQALAPNPDATPDVVSEKPKLQRIR